ncbi:MAG: LPS export ABC transporter periplasmic protein LptC [Candidatus Omnitrophota bacterium]
MRIKSILILAAVINLSFSSVYAKEEALQDESDQQIGDFSLAGYGEKGKKSWDICGKTADIFDEIVKLKSVIGNLYGVDENIQLTADRGDFNKKDGKVHLEQNVIITTSSGAKLCTESLEWDRKAQVVSTEELVNIERNNMVAAATGARGEPNLNKVSLEKNVRLDISPAGQSAPEPGASGVKEKIIITCDGPLEIDYEKNIAVFKNNVKVERADSVIYSDIMHVYFSRGKDDPIAKAGITASSINRIVAKGNVRVVRGENVSYSEEAVYTAEDRKIILSGRPRLVIYSTEDLKDASFGN